MASVTVAYWSFISFSDVQPSCQSAEYELTYQNSIK